MLLVASDIGENHFCDIYLTKIFFVLNVFRYSPFSKGEMRECPTDK